MLTIKIKTDSADFEDNFNKAITHALTLIARDIAYARLYKRPHITGLKGKAWAWNNANPINIGTWTLKLKKEVFHG